MIKQRKIKEEKKMELPSFLIKYQQRLNKSFSSSVIHNSHQLVLKGIFRRVGQTVLAVGSQLQLTRQKFVLKIKSMYVKEFSKYLAYYFDPNILSSLINLKYYHQNVAITNSVFSLIKGLIFSQLYRIDGGVVSLQLLFIGCKNMQIYKRYLVNTPQSLQMVKFQKYYGHDYFQVTQRKAFPLIFQIAFKAMNYHKVKESLQLFFQNLSLKDLIKIKIFTVQILYSQKLLESVWDVLRSIQVMKNLISKAYILQVQQRQFLYKKFIAFLKLKDPLEIRNVLFFVMFILQQNFTFTNKQFLQISGLSDKTYIKWLCQNFNRFITQQNISTKKQTIIKQKIKLFLKHISAGPIDHVQQLVQMLKSQFSKAKQLRTRKPMKFCRPELVALTLLGFQIFSKTQLIELHSSQKISNQIKLQGHSIYQNLLKKISSRPNLNHCVYIQLLKKLAFIDPESQNRQI